MPSGTFTYALQVELVPVEVPVGAPTERGSREMRCTVSSKWSGANVRVALGHSYRGGGPSARQCSSNRRYAYGGASRRCGANPSSGSHGSRRVRAGPSTRRSNSRSSIGAVPDASAASWRPRHSRTSSLRTASSAAASSSDFFTAARSLETCSTRPSRRRTVVFYPVLRSRLSSSSMSAGFVR
jgi:hypothetical protein